jgi:hypothetical protein
MDPSVVKRFSSCSIYLSIGRVSRGHPQGLVSIKNCPSPNRKLRILPMNPKWILDQVQNCKRSLMVGI